MAGEEGNTQQAPKPESKANELHGIVKDIEVVPETLRGFYVKTEEGDYRLNAAGLVPKKKLDEFRENNISLTNEHRQLIEKFKDIDLEEYKTLKGEKKKQKDQKLIDEGKVDELVAERVTGFRKTLEERASGAERERDGYRSRLETVLIDNEIQRRAIAAGARESAMEDFLSRGRSLWKMVEDTVKPMRGERVVTGEDGVSVLTFDEWFATLKRDAPHLFKQSEGSGAGGNGSHGASGITKRSQLKTAKEKSDFISQHGQAKFLSLPLN